MKRAGITKLLAGGLLLCFIVGILAVACETAPISVVPGSKPAGAKYGGTLKRCTDLEANLLGDPASTGWTIPGFKMASPAVETLFRFDNKGVAVPWLATGYKVSADLTTITITLRNGVKFHDGTDFNATAVKWNLDHYRNSPATADLKAVKSVDIIDANTIRINLSKWDNTIIDSLAYTAGMMISPAAYDKGGTTDEERSNRARTNPVGTGPFQFVSWQRDVVLKYKKNTSYWQEGKPYLDAIEYSCIVDGMSRMLAFKKGEIDELPAMDLKDVNDIKKAGFNVLMNQFSTYGCGVAGDSVNPESPFANIKVRQAMEYAVDKQALVNAMTFGFGKISTQWGSPQLWGINPDVKGYPYDPNKAKQLLSEAGYANGLKIKFGSMTWGLYAQFTPALQEFYRKVGITAELDMMDQGRDQQLRRSGWKNQYVTQACSYVLTDIAKQLYQNLSNDAPYISKSIAFPQDYNDAVTKAINAADFETKKKFTWEAQKLLVDKYALVQFYYTQPRVIGFNSRVHDTGTADSIDPQWSPANAWVE